MGDRLLRARGQLVHDRIYRGTVILIEGDKLYFTNWFTKSAAAAFKLDTKAKPRAIDIGGEEAGIYELNGDTLKLCLNTVGKRPKEFKTAAGDKTNLMVLKRQKPFSISLWPR